MLIRNRIADIDISENIDLERQLRHFREVFDGYEATWDLRFDDTSRTNKNLQIVLMEFPWATIKIPSLKKGKIFFLK